jgi:hypothetical protein
MKTIISIALAFIILTVHKRATGQASVQDLEKYLDTIISNPSTPLPPSVLIDFKNEPTLIKHLLAHRSDPGEEFQFRVLDLMRLMAVKSKNNQVRRSVVHHFVQTIPDKNLRVSGFASGALIQFLKPDFSEQNKDSIVSYLGIGIPNLGHLFRLAAFLEAPSAKEKISSMLIYPMSPLLKWNARLALSRLGDENATNFVLEKIATSTIDDSFVSSIIPGLVYTRNKKIFIALEKILQSDAYNCRSPHPDSKASILCAFRVLENIAGAIEKFPIKVDESGDLLVDDYQSALDTARRWLKQNPDYKLDTNTM